MKTTDFRFVACFIVIILSCRPLEAQPWTYDFGTGTGTHTSGASDTFLPAPASGGTRVRVGTQGGSAALQNPGDTRLGSASECVLTAPAGSSLNKLQWHDFSGGYGFTVQANLSVGGGTGDIYFFCGNGSCFSDNLGFSGTQVFAAVKWSNDTTRLSMAVRQSGGWNALPSGTMMKDSVHLLELYANNSALGITYAHSTSQSLAAYSWDLWIDGALVANDVPGAGLPDTTEIDSFMFYAAASPANSCRLRLDDLAYTNCVALQPLPVEMTSFEVRQRNGSAWLRWKTETEVQNFGFEIQRRPGDGDWERRGFLPGDGDRATPRWYEFDDRLDGLCGSVGYRLRQIDRDGSVTVTEPIFLTVPCDGDDGNVSGRGGRSDLLLGIPWPQPAEDALSVPIRVLAQREVTIELLTLAGTRVAVLPAVRLLPAGWQDLRLHGLASCNGPYFLVLHSAGSLATRLLFL